MTRAQRELPHRHAAGGMDVQGGQVLHRPARLLQQPVDVGPRLLFGSLVGQWVVIGHGPSRNTMPISSQIVLHFHLAHRRVPILEWRFAPKSIDAPDGLLGATWGIEQYLQPSLLTALTSPFPP